jgi:DNA-directed RNA polymerase II subunit RPB1
LFFIFLFYLFCFSFLFLCILLSNDDMFVRNLEDGDPVLFNRQPSLHKNSIMCARAKIHDDDTAKLHLGVTVPLGADFDGDEITLHVPHDSMSCAEAETLMSVGENMVKEGKLIVGFVQHAAIGVYKLTSECEAIFSYQDVYQLAMRGNNMDLMMDVMSRWPTGRNAINGKQVFQMMLTTYEGKEVLTKSHLNGLLFLKMQQTGSNCIRLLSFLTRILEQYAVECGVSINLKDYIVSVQPQTKEQVHAIVDCANKLSETIKTDEEERAIIASLSRAREMLANDAIATLRKRKYGNGLLDVICSGAKGNLTHIAQSVSMVGIQVNQSNQLIQLTLNHFFRTNLERLAFIYRSFFTGLTPLEFYYHLMSTRVGLIGTALNTADTGPFLFFFSHM